MQNATKGKPILKFKGSNIKINIGIEMSVILLQLDVVYFKSQYCVDNLY